MEYEMRFLSTVDKPVTVVCRRGLHRGLIVIQYHLVRLLPHLWQDCRVTGRPPRRLKISSGSRYSGGGGIRLKEEDEYSALSAWDCWMLSAVCIRWRAVLQGWQVSSVQSYQVVSIETYKLTDPSAALHNISSLRVSPAWMCKLYPGQ